MIVIEGKNIINLTNYMEMSNYLKKLECESDKIKLESIGKSVLGRDIYLIKVGKYNPEKKTVLILAQQHGNEGIPTEGILNALEKIVNNTDGIYKIIEKINLLIIPRLNVDKSDLIDNEVPTRANINGVDLNRDHISRSQPETIALHENVLKKYKIDYAMDFHQQHENITSILYPTNKSIEKDVIETSKKLGIGIYTQIENKKIAHLSKYHGDNSNSIARNNLAYNYKIGTVLFEMKGIIDYNKPYYKKMGKKNLELINQATVIIEESIRVLANINLENIDLNTWNIIKED